MSEKILSSQMLLLPLEPSERFKHIFQTILRKPVEVVITTNVFSLFSVKRIDKKIIVRLSNIFLTADDGIIRELALFALNRQPISKNVRYFLKKQTLSQRKIDKHINIKHAGRHYDLLEIYNRLNREYFDNGLNVKISWGKSSNRRRVRTRQLGNYNENYKLIRISPVLDNEMVPLFYLEYVVYHEMLHAYIGIKNVNGRRQIHNKEFKEKERQFRFYKEAISWEKSNKL